jgi:aspartate kinase
MIVMKFGGTSVGSAKRIKAVANIIKQNLNREPLVVVSAVGGVTDRLIEAADKALNGSCNISEIQEKHSKILSELNLSEDLVKNELKELNKLLNNISVVKEVTTETLDHVTSFGERMSSKILAAYLNNLNVKAEAHNAYYLGLVTNDIYVDAQPLPVTEENLRKNLNNRNAVPVITKNKAGNITTLGRGGSDYTASIVGTALDVEEIQIWTDVDGIMTADPKIVKDAKTIDKISFNEASELAYFGAKVLHPRTILPAMEKNIPVRILNTYNPSGKGTLILKEANKSEQIVKAIAFKKNINLIGICSTRMLMAHGFLARLFKIFDKYKVVVDMIATSEVSVSVTVDKDENLDNVVKELENIAKVKLEKNKAIVCVVGEGMRHTKGVAGKLFATLGNKGINIEMISQGASEINIGFIVGNEYVEKAVQVLHREFFCG